MVRPFGPAEVADLQGYPRCFQRAGGQGAALQPSDESLAMASALAEYGLLASAAARKLRSLRTDPLAAGLLCALKCWFALRA